MNEVDEKGQVLATFTHANWPIHMSIDSEGHTLVADFGNHCILLLSSDLKLQRVLINTDSEVSLREPTRLSYNELTSQMYVVLNSKRVSVFRLR